MDASIVKDKRVKREIANSNERRRMQSINAGFQKLKRLLPVNDGEKISKANILQHAANYIQTIQRDRLTLYEQNTRFRAILLDLKEGKIEIGAALDSVDLSVLPKDIPINPVANLSDSTDSSPSLNSNFSTTNNNTIKNNRATSAGTATPINTYSVVNNANPTTNTFSNNINNNFNSTNTASRIHNNSSNDNAVEKSTPPTTTLIATTTTSNDDCIEKKFNITKAAIALPLEVPYQQHQHHTRKLLNAPKGQNLDTICKAIMEIEGDHEWKVRL